MSTKKNRDRLRELVESGASLEKCCNELGVQSATIYIICREHGIPVPMSDAQFIPKRGVFDYPVIGDKGEWNVR